MDPSSKVMTENTRGKKKHCLEGEGAALFGGERGKDMDLPCPLQPNTTVPVSAALSQFTVRSLQKIQEVRKKQIYQEGDSGLALAAPRGERSRIWIHLLHPFSAAFFCIAAM